MHSAFAFSPVLVSVSVSPFGQIFGVELNNEAKELYFPISIKQQQQQQHHPKLSFSAKLTM